MARKPKPPSEDPRDKLEREGISRLEECRKWKSLWDLDLRECYFFASPQRQRQIQSYAQPPQQRLLDAAELNTDVAFELCADFATEVINTYLPEAQRWCERGKGMFMSQEAFDKIADRVRASDDQIFTMIKASNFYAELSKTFDPDIAIGTVAMWIDPPRPGEAIVCSAIPIREFEINLGPYGEIDDRFTIRFTRNSFVRRLVGEEIWGKISAEVKATIDDKPAQKTEVRWGFWRLWDRHDDEVWQHVVYVGNDLVHDALLIGEGSCPMLVFRWNPNPDWPWGHGPLLQYLPTLRQVDELEIYRAEHAEFSIRPSVSVPSDSFANLEQGFEPGMAYPRLPGPDNEMKPIWMPPPTEAGNFQYEEKLQHLRKGFYVDFPQQSGDTPPTLGQWLDEMARAQRRIGRPGLPFWREGPAKIFIRFKYLGERAGAIEPIKVDEKTVALMPYNPAQRAAEQQDIAMAAQFSQMMGQMFPEEWKMAVDGTMTMEAFAEKMRVSGLIKFRDKNKVNAALGQIAKLVGARHEPGAQVPQTGPQAPGAPGPT